MDKRHIGVLKLTILSNIEVAFRCVLKLKKKLNFIIFIIVSLFLPLSITRSHHSLDYIYKKVINKVINNLDFNGLIICMDKIYYSLIDYESLYIITPRFESYINSKLNIEMGDTFIDVGAHIGKYSLKAARIIGDEGLIIAIEPAPENYRHLVRGIKLNDFKNIVALNIAAWKEKCTLRIYFGDVAGHHTTKIDTGLGFFIAEAETLDNIVKKINLKKVDWIKIDVEGAEFEVLKGSIDIINEFKPKIIIEVFPENFEKIYNLLKKNKYLLTEISPTSIGNLSYYIAEPIIHSINIT